jgi:hypothetical protein
MAVLKVVIHGEWDWGDQTRNVFYLEGADATLSNGNDIVDAIIDCLMQNKAQFADNYAMTGGTCYDLSTPEVPGTFFSHSSGDQAGTGTGDPLAGQIAVLLNFWSYTNKPNRKRTYIAGQTEGSMTSGLWTSALQTAFSGVVDDLLDFDTFSSLDARMCAYGKLSDGVTYDLNFLDDGRVEAVPATQRRRRRGSGI